MNIRFTKMQGAGNDFVVINALAEPFALSPAQIKQLADRHFGIGCDQLLVVEKATRPEADFRYRIFNADGGEVEQCGNGARCFVRFVHDEGLTTQRQIRVETLSGIISPRLEDSGQVTVDMGQPRFLPAEIPFISESQAIIQPLQVGDTAIDITVVSMGNPHAVQVVADTDTAPVEKLGPLIESHPRFPQRVNAGFMQMIDAHTIRLRVYERGAGETLACGTGACAAAVAGIRRGMLASPVHVVTQGGDLSIAWDGQGSVLLTGPAVSVFSGEMDLPDA
ncbi:MAG: diaminopimelate epimerase [Rugosibacter sp.]|nr:diaminopimelate epimerase [Rugosibacter sp.]